MCGICGIWNFDASPVRPDVLDAMRDCMYRRGPDDMGRYLAGGVGLGHRRLNIIDLATGHQPLSNEDGTIWITYNGEVYNFPELRAGLEAKGHSFRTQTDTEVVVHLYEEMGPQCVERLRGMFAFALWDSRHQQMVLARDRLGEKPLYYLYDGRRLAFASELKALLLAGGVARQLDPQALDAYLTLDYVPAPLTIYQGIRKLPPAHLLVCREGQIQVERYWKPRMVATSQEVVSQPRVEDYAEKLLALLNESVQMRLVSDVPLGVLLSGGVDSSTILALMAQATDQPIKTFSIGSADPEFNELPYARQIANHFSTQHHEFVVEPDVLAVLPELLHAYDEPFADSSAFPTYYVSRLARQHVTVALAGEGGDELFAGYPWYKILADKSWVYRMPGPLRQALFGLPYPIWPAHWRGKGRLHMWRQTGPAQRYATTRNRFPPHERQQLLTPELQEMLAAELPCDTVARAANEAQMMDRVSMMQYADLMTYLPEDLLVKVDRASMWNSLEVRSPLLDHKLVEFVLAIPPQLKLANGTSKYILKHVMESWIPRELLHRPKMGFGIPIKKWFTGEWLTFANEVLLSDAARQRSYFHPAYVKALLEQHGSGRGDPTITTHRIWNLLYLELWCQEFLDKIQSGEPRGTFAYGSPR